MEIVQQCLVNSLSLKNPFVFKCNFRGKNNEYYVIYVYLQASLQQLWHIKLRHRQVKQVLQSGFAAGMKYNNALKAAKKINYSTAGMTKK